MKKHTLTLSSIFLSILIIIGAYFYTEQSVFADGCEEGQVMCNDQCVSGCTEGKVMDQSDCTCSCGASEDECLGSCYSQCPINTSRDTESCECVPDTCDNGATNPPLCTSCPAGKDMCLGTCYSACESGYIRNTESCECVPDTCDNGATNPSECTECPSGEVIDPAPPYHCVAYCNDPEACNYEEYGACDYSCADECCSDERAKNYDDACPDPEADPEKIENNDEICEFCTKESTDFECEVYYCDADEFPLATNKQTLAECDVANPDNPCISYESECEWPQITYCSDTTTPAQNGQTQAECDNSIPINWPACEPDNSTCTYPDNYYCDDPEASNYEEYFDCVNRVGGLGECVADSNVCEYNSCSVGFSIDLTCPSGFEFKTPPNEYYWYSYPLAVGTSCSVNLDTAQIDYLQAYFASFMCEESSVPSCPGGICGTIDWCPTITGVQTDPSLCIDVCPNKPGIQINEGECNTNNICVNLGNIPLPIGYYITQQNQCFPCKNGVCQPTNGVCGTATITGASYASNINGPSACAAGIKSTVTKSDRLFTWSCLGTEGGMDQGCQANLMCENGLSYCENKGICSDKCYEGNDCVNSNICVFKGSVSLNTKLDVTPIIERNGTCTVNVDRTSEVFDAFDIDTHCTLSSQDGVIATFDPVNLITDGNNMTRYSVPNVKKDMTFTLRCHDGEVTETTTYETSVGSCRLNIKTLEAN